MYLRYLEDNKNNIRVYTDLMANKRTLNFAGKTKPVSTEINKIEVPPQFTLNETNSLQTSIGHLDSI
jgi:hypothetical protein